MPLLAVDARIRHRLEHPEAPLQDAPLELRRSDKGGASDFLVRQPRASLTNVSEAAHQCGNRLKAAAQNGIAINARRIFIYLNLNVSEGAVAAPG